MDANGNQPDEVTRAALEAVSEATELTTTGLTTAGPTTTGPATTGLTARGRGMRGRIRRRLARRGDRHGCSGWASPQV